MVEAAVQIEKLIEFHDNEKIILRYLFCASHYHELVCKESCKLHRILHKASTTFLLLSEPPEKVEFFQKHCRTYYSEVIDFYDF